MHNEISSPYINGGEERIFRRPFGYGRPFWSGRPFWYGRPFGYGPFLGGVLGGLLGSLLGSTLVVPFTFGSPYPFGYGGYPFYPYW